MLLEKEDCCDLVQLNDDREIIGDNLKKTLQLMALSVNDNQLIHVKNASSGREAWKSKNELIKRKSMQVYFEKIFQDLDELSVMGAAVDDKSVIHVELSSLHEEYDVLITALEA